MTLEDLLTLLCFHIFIFKDCVDGDDEGRGVKRSTYEYMCTETVGGECMCWGWEWPGRGQWEKKGDICNTSTIKDLNLKTLC